MFLWIKVMHFILTLILSTPLRSIDMKLHPIGINSSYQNGPVKCAHQVIGDHVCALLIGASLDIKFWPYAFFHHLLIQNAMAMNGQNSSRIFQATGTKENF